MFTTIIQIILQLLEDYVYNYHPNYFTTIGRLCLQL
jgi:hypothetical protein